MRDCATNFAALSQNIASIYKDIGKEWKMEEQDVRFSEWFKGRIFW